LVVTIPLRGNATSSLSSLTPLCRFHATSPAIARAVTSIFWWRYEDVPSAEKVPVLTTVPASVRCKVATTQHAIANVVGLRSRIEMIAIDAYPVVARMARLQGIADRKSQEQTRDLL
jgi:hypothetical protein